MIRITTVSVLSLAISSPLAAWAQDGTAPVPEEAPAAAPAPRAARPFNLADLSMSRTLGGEVSYMMFDFEEGIEGSALQVGIVAEFEVAPGVEVFGRLPWVSSSLSAGDQSIDDEAIGNVSVGGRYVIESGADLTLGFSGTVYLPTTESFDEDGDSPEFGGLAAFITDVARDMPRWFPDALALEPGVAARFGVGMVTLQGEANLLMFFYTGDGNPRDEQFNMLQLDFGVAARVAPELSVLAELVTVFDAFDELDDDVSSFVSLDVGARYHLHKVALGGHFYYPVDENQRDQGTFGFVFDVFGEL
jgi:hypothetical protein